MDFIGSLLAVLCFAGAAGIASESMHVGLLVGVGSLVTLVLLYTMIKE